MAKAEKPDGRRANGRPKGSINKRSEEAIKKAKKGGILPLDFLLGQMRDERNAIDVRIEAAKAAARYVHASLKAVEVSGTVGLTHEQALQALGD